MITTPIKLWRRQKEVAAVIGKTGVLVQWTIIRTPPKSFVKEAPYPPIQLNLNLYEEYKSLCPRKNTFIR